MAEEGKRRRGNKKKDREEAIMGGERRKEEREEEKDKPGENRFRKGGNMQTRENRKENKNGSKK